MAQPIGADSLVDMARRACTRYSARITDIGDLRYELIRPVLMKIESPEKLYLLEQNSPQIIGRDAEIWLSFIKRDIPDWQSKRHEPKDPKNWYKVYRKLKKEAQEDSVADETLLKAALANIKNEKDQNVAQMSSRHIVTQQPARRARIYHNYISGRTGSKGASKMTLMEKIRKEAKDAKASKMNKPMHELRKAATTVIKPPQQFVEDLKRKPAASTQSSPPPRAPIKVSRPPLHGPGPRTNRPPVDATYDLTSDREARLRALKSGNNKAPDPSVISGDGDLTVDFLEDSDAEEQVAPRPCSSLLNVLDDIERPRASSPMKLNAQPSTLKRKQPPSLFMSSPKKITKRPGIS